MKVDNLFWGMVVAGIAVGITQKILFYYPFCHCGVH